MRKVLLLLLFANVAFAQPAYHFDLLKDINAKSNDANIKLVKNVINSTVIFQIDKDINTNTQKLRLWSYDGTTLKNFASSDLFDQFTTFISTTVIDNYIFFYTQNSSFNTSFYVVKLNSPFIKKISDVIYNPTVVKLNSKFYYNTNLPDSEGRLYYYNEANNQSIEIQGASLNFYNPTSLTVVNNQLYFTASTGADANKRQQLWVTDGTNAGTHVVKELAAGGAMLGHMARAGNKVIFDAVENSTYAVYVSDGTTVGTYAFRDFESFANLPGSFPNIFGIRNYGDKAVLLLQNAFDYSPEMWMTDGTDANTKLMIIYDSIGLLENNEIATKDGSLFTVLSGVLFRTDGTTTTVLKNSGIPELYRNDFKMIPNSVDNRLYFSLGEIFFKTDGTSAGTELISDKLETTIEVWRTNPYALTANKIIAYTRPKTYNKFGKELYEISADTIRIVKDLDSTTNGSQPQFLLNTQGKSYFLAQDGETDYLKVFETDGTTEGTRSIAIGYSSPFYQYFMLNKDLYAIRDDQLQKFNFSANSYENISTLPRYTTEIAPIQTNNKAYFVIGDTYGDVYRELWVTSGTNAGTTLIKTFVESDRFQQFIVHNQQLYFFTKAENTLKIWKLMADNTAPVLIKTINGDAIKTTYSGFRNQLAFLIDVANGMELWVTDGTANGTNPINSFPPRTNEELRNFYFTDSHYYFSEYTNHRTKVWKSEGSPANTTLIADVLDTDSDVTQFCLCNNAVFFGLFRTENTGVSYLYKYDTATNTTSFLNQIGYLWFGDKKHFKCLNKQLYFPAIATPIGLPKIYIYTSNGTPEGTKEIISLENRPDYDSYPRIGALYPLNDQELLVSVNDKLYDVEWFTFRKCDNPTNLSGTTTDSKIQSSTTFIESTEKLTGNGRVAYLAPKSITLKAGFSVDNTSVFRAEIKNRACTLRQ